jgi:Rieske Fe-S protein
MTQDDELATVTRRTLLAGAGVISVAVLGGCATYGPGGSTGGGGTDTGGDTGDTGNDPSNADSLDASKIPVGGGVVVGDRAVVVTHPKAAEFKAFTAVCTHQGCTVASVRDNVITCPCHGSQFSGTDGSVVTGPANRPLKSVAITVSGSSITFS